MTTETHDETPAMKIDAAIESLNLTFEATFVPFSQSRNRDEKQPSLNWRVKMFRAGRLVIETDYTAGCAHAPSYKYSFGKKTLEQRDTDLKVRWECETGGKATSVTWTGGEHRVFGTKPGSLKPNFRDVLYSIVMDSDVLDYPTYERWAAEFGYDPDSRKGEATYQACLKIALAVRSGIGEQGIELLKEVFQDY